MSRSVIIGALLVAGVAWLILSGASVTDDSTDNVSAAVIVPKISSAETIEAVLKEVAQVQLASPDLIFESEAQTPKELKQYFEKLGTEWASQNVAHLAQSNAQDCPGPSSDSPNHTLHVRYVYDYPFNQSGQANILYTEIPVPAGIGGDFKYQTPMVKEVIYRDQFEWERISQTKWWTGVDEEWKKELRAEQDRLSQIFMTIPDQKSQQAVSVARRIAEIEMRLRQGLVRGMNKSVNDVVEVKAPAPAWSFKYDNYTKKGDPLRKRKAKTNYAAHSATIEAHAADLIAILNPLAQFGQRVTRAGTREILGYTCEVLKSSDWDAEACITEISGQQIALWKRIDRVESTVVYLDPQPCVSLAQFMPPADVEFAANW